MTGKTNTVRKSFSLDALLHHDILEYLDGQDSISETVRAALRQYMSGRQDMTGKIDELGKQIEEILYVIRSGEFVKTVQEIEEPITQPASELSASASNNLDNLTDKWK